MTPTAMLSLSLAERDAEAIAAMASALALPVDDFLAKVVAGWLEKPKNYRRFAKRLLADGADERVTELRRKRAKTVVKALKRARRASDIALPTGEGAPKRKAAKAAKAPLTTASAEPALAAIA